MVFASLSNRAVDTSFLAVQDVQLLQNVGDGRLMVVFVGIAALSLLVLTLLAVGTLVALLVVGIKAKRSFGETVREFKGRATRSKRKVPDWSVIWLPSSKACRVGPMRSSLTSRRPPKESLKRPTF